MGTSFYLNNLEIEKCPKGVGWLFVFPFSVIHPKGEQ